MNDDFYKDDPVIKLRPSHIRKQRKPPFVREFGLFSPKLLNREPVPSDREGYYLYYYMESYQTSRTVEKGGRNITVYDRHSTRKSVEVTLEQWQELHKFDCENYKINRREEEKLEYEPKINNHGICTLDALLQTWDNFDLETFLVNAMDLERVLNSLSDEDLDIYIYAKEKHFKQKKIAEVIGKSESYITRRMKVIEDAIERDMIDDGQYATEKEVFAELEYRKYARTGKTETYADVFVYDYLTSLPQEMVLRYLFLFRGQQYLIRFIFKWLVLYDGKHLHAKEEMSKYSAQLYKKYAVKMKVWAKRLFIALELELDRLVKQYGIKDSRPNEKFLKAVQKAAASKGMTVAEYRDKILFPHGKERVITRYKKFVKQHPEAKGTPKPPTKDNRSALMTKNFVNRKR